MRAAQVLDKLLKFIETAHTKGRKHSEVLTKFRLSAAEAQSCLAILTRQGSIFDLVHGSAGSGRRARQYYAARYKEELFAGLTTEENTVTVLPEAEFDLDAPTATAQGRCRQCGCAIPTISGQPIGFCSEKCRRHATWGASYLQEMCARAHEQHTFGPMAWFLVAADLASRGFYLGMRLPDAGATLLVSDAAGTTIECDVLALDSTGHVPVLDDYDSVAVVLGDGQIVYGGKNPLVTPDQPRDDGVLSESEENSTNAET